MLIARLTGGAMSMAGRLGRAGCLMVTGRPPSEPSPRYPGYESPGCAELPSRAEADPSRSQAGVLCFVISSQLNAAAPGRIPGQTTRNLGSDIKLR